MRSIAFLTLLLLASLAAEPARAACAKEDFAQAVDKAGEALRRVNSDNAPRLRAKLRQLKDARGWPDAGFEERAFGALQDERIAALDAQANELLAKLDQLGTIEPAGEPDCAKLQELTAASIELQATVKAKAAYTLAKIDQMLAVGTAPIAPEPRSAEPKAAGPKAAEPKAKPPEVRKAPPQAPPTAATPKAAPPAVDERAWSAQTKGDTPPRPGEVASAEPTPLPPMPPRPYSLPDEDGYTIDEIMAASAGFFGKVSSGLGAVIEHLFKSAGRPTGYVLGTEGGGAFLAGVRYGEGRLYMRSGGTQPIFWHGPSIGTDLGASGSKTLFLIYRLRSPDDLYANFTGIDGSAYLVGGVGVTLLTNTSVILAPIRSGVGLRLGANIGYIRFTSRATWNPF